MLYFFFGSGKILVRHSIEISVWGKARRPRKEKGMQKKYERASLIVTAEQYELDKGLEDGFELYTKVITNGWISTDGLFKLTRPDGSVVCPFIQNRRGVIFIREGDYIITENDHERHVCGADKFFKRFTPVED